MFTPGPRDLLKELLQERPSDCQKREQRTFDELTRHKAGLVLFGAGGLGRKVLSALWSDGIEPFAFVDNRLSGRLVDGVRVLSPAEASAQWGWSAAFVVTIWASWADTMLEQIRSLRDVGCETVVSFIPLLWKYPQLLPHVQIDLPSRVLEQRDKVKSAFELWADDASREEFARQLQWRLYGDFEALGGPIPSQYWQRDLVKLKDDAVFVDAGAFDGDTFAQFVSFTGGNFRRAYVFEPDRQNLHSIQNRLNAMPESTRARAIIFDAAVGEANYCVPFSSVGGTSSAAGLGSETVRCVALDNVLPEAPSLIKYDIEGFELLGLRGSRRIIRDHAPTLAVCAYHTQSHLWEIPLEIASLNPNYSFYLRAHGQVWETVCYAIPRSSDK